jgi:hypothetical protein
MLVNVDRDLTMRLETREGWHIAGPAKQFVVCTPRRRAGDLQLRTADAQEAQGPMPPTFAMA